MKKYLLLLFFLPSVIHAGASRSFSGTNQFIQSSLVPNFGSNGWSVCTWLKPTAANQQTVLLETAAQSEWAIWTNLATGTDGTTGFNINLPNSSSLVLNGGTLSTSWMHFCYTGSASGATGTIYMNGVSTASATGLQTLNGFSVFTLLIGKRRADTSIEWQGQIADVRLYNKALTASEVKAVYLGDVNANETNLILLYPLADSGSNPTFVDFSKSKNSGSNNNTTESFSGPPHVYFGGEVF